ncbi:hypothetical protein, partial [Secundilactobacillus similis]
QQPTIIATQHTPSRLPTSHIAQFGTIAAHLKRLTERLATVSQRLTLSRQTLKLINNRCLVIVTDKTSIYSER